MPAKGQALDGSQRGEGFKHTSFVFSACARVPDSARQIKLPQMREAFEFAELDGVHDGSAEIYGGNVEVARRQTGDIADGLARPFQDQTAFPAERPLCDLAFRRCRRDDCKKSKEAMSSRISCYSTRKRGSAEEPPA